MERVQRRGTGLKTNSKKQDLHEDRHRMPQKGTDQIILAETCKERLLEETGSGCLQKDEEVYEKYQIQ